jgi:hypothetical protein
MITCPNYTTSDGIAATVTEGDDANALGDESDEFRVDFVNGHDTVGHGIVWESRAGDKIWRLIYVYPGAYDRNEAKKLTGRAIAKWRTAQTQQN